METLSRFNRIVDISEPLLAEDSTSTLSLSLLAVLEQLDTEKAIHHDYLVALLLVLLAESGFYTLNTSESVDETSGSSMSNNSEKKDNRTRNTRLVHISTNWKSQNLGLYEIYFVLLRSGIQSKLIVKPIGDKLILIMYPYIENKRVYSMIVKTLMYVNPYTNRLCNRYKNLKIISHRFKNEVAIPVRTDIFCSLKLTNPSLQGLPPELLLVIKQFLNERDFKKMTVALCRPCSGDNL